MAVPDPSGARHRDFDIPVVMPRFDFIDLPMTAEPVTTLTCATPDAVVAAPSPAATPATGPVIKLGLPLRGQRKSAFFIKNGLAFNLTSDKGIADAEVRLVQLFADGSKRPLGVALMLPAGRKTTKVIVVPTAFAKSKLSIPAKRRTVRAVALVTAADGTVGQTFADFELT